MIATDFIQSPGQHTLFIHFQADQPHTEHARGSDQPGISQLFGDHRIACAQQRHHRAEQPMLAAVDANNLLRDGMKIALHQPLRARFPVTRQAGVRRVGTDVLEKLGVGRQGLEALRQEHRLLPRNMHVAAHVEVLARLLAEVAKTFIPLTLHPTLAHERAVTDPRHHQPQAFQLAVGPADGADGHPQIVGKHPMGRQFSSRFNQAFEDAPFHDIG